MATGLMTSVMWLPFFNIGMGLSPVVLGFHPHDPVRLGYGRGPDHGNISGNARTRWGRRRPFMFVGAITTAALYPLMWHFPESILDGTSWLATAAGWIPFIDCLGMDAGGEAMSHYLVLVGVVFFTSFSCWSMPYYGLQLELTPNYDERTRLTAIMALISTLTSLVTGWAFVGTVAQGDLKTL